MAELRAGDPAPDFTALDDAGSELRLSSLRGQKVVLYFYPKDDTTGCTQQACGFRDLGDEFSDAQAVVLGVSPDGVKSHQKFKDKNSLPFSLVVDQDHGISEAYGVWQEKSMYGRKYMGVLRSHFVIDESGKIVEAHYKVKPAESAPLSLHAVRTAAGGR